jgi:transcriptional regulator
MYTPASFRVTDSDKLTRLMQNHSFATLVSNGPDGPLATHLPILYHPDVGPYGTLVSHMARANPHWQLFQSGEETLAIFQGPHSYVSPSWYADTPAVPTWNYAAVHAYGTPQIIDDHERVVQLLDETVDRYESRFDQPWTLAASDAYRDQLIQAIVAFEVPIARLEGKFKLGQNRSEADRCGVFEILTTSEDQRQSQLADLIRREGLGG